MHYYQCFQSYLLSQHMHDTSKIILFYRGINWGSETWNPAIQMAPVIWSWYSFSRLVSWLFFFKWYGFWSSHWLDQDYRLFFFFDKLLACFPVKLFFSSFDLFLKRKCSSTEMAVTTQSVLICVTPWPSSKYQVVLVYTFSHVINKLRCNWFSSLY